MSASRGGAAPAVKRWFGKAKRRLGYYEARARWREPRFRRALRPTDAFLVGHPKSGNTWLAYMLAVLLFDDLEGRINLLNVGDYVPFVHGRDHQIARYGHLPDPRVFRNELPEQGRLYPRTLYLMRDPRAVLVSLWHMYGVLFGDRTTSLGSFVDQYLRGTGCFTHWHRRLVRWDRQVASALEAAGEGRTRIVRYEDLSTDRRGTLRQIAAFLGAPHGEQRLAEAAARGSFDAMRRMEDRHGAEAYEGQARGSGRFVRRGEAEGWRSEMGRDIVARVEAELGPAMRAAGYL